MYIFRVASLKSGGLILPAEVKIHGLFIESEELESMSHVTGNDKTLGFQIADFINVFQVQKLTYFYHYYLHAIAF